MERQPAWLDTYGFGLSPQEKEVLDMSAALYNAISALPDKHPSDMGETLLDIHRIQNRVMARVAVRNQPNFFTAAPAPSVISFTGHADMPIEAIEVGPSFDTPLPTSECEDLREDAERYRWLRENCGYSGSGPHNGVQVIVYYADAGDGKHGIAYTGPRQRVGIMALDDAIDAAMKATE